MKRSIASTSLTIILFLIFVTAQIHAQSTTPQTQKPTTQTPVKPKPKKRKPPTPPPAPIPDMRSEATQVAAQINNISRFLFIYGKVVNGIELSEQQAKNNPGKPAAPPQNKELIIKYIRDLRTGLNGVAINFQGIPRLQTQYLKISAAAQALDNAELLASSGRFDDAGRSMISAVEKLTEAMLSMKLN